VPATVAPLLPAAPVPASEAIGKAVQAEAVRLRAIIAREVPVAMQARRQPDQTWIALTKAALAASPYRIERPQLVVTVDRAPRVQELVIMLAQPGNQPWQVLGGSRVSTGQAGRRAYFIMPTGVFRHTTDIVDYRALGTYNENRIRGLGVKGMRAWDFGWQTAQKGWLPDGETGEIRLLLHATDPDVLEPRLGRPASQGCVRVPAGMNRFLDAHGVLDAEYERGAADDPKLAAVLLPERTPTSLAGDLLVIVDSLQPSPVSMPSAPGSPTADTRAERDGPRKSEPDRPARSSAAGSAPSEPALPDRAADRHPSGQITPSRFNAATPSAPRASHSP
jgi:hypothetical protein